MTNYEIQLEGIVLNISPEGFHRWATHYYKCKQDFVSPHKFSPVPYFLLCRAIELEIKSKHLIGKRQREVKDKYSHDLISAYKDLPQSEKILSEDELVILKGANKIYMSKGFEYFQPYDAATGYSAFPELNELDAIAIKLIRNSTLR